MVDKFVRIITAENRRNVMNNAWELTGELLKANDSIQIEIRERRRSDEQNAKLHAMLSDITKKNTFNGKKLTLEQWKLIFISGHSIATGGQADMTIGLEGEIINLRESTAKMSVRRLSSLIEYISAWQAENEMPVSYQLTGCHNQAAGEKGLV